MMNAMGHLFLFVFVHRDPVSAPGATEMSWATDRDAGAASSGSAGFLSQESRDRKWILTQPWKARRALYGKDTQH